VEISALKLLLFHQPVLTRAKNGTKDAHSSGKARKYQRCNKGCRAAIVDSHLLLYFFLLIVFTCAETQFGTK